MSQVARYWPDRDYVHLLGEATRAADNTDEIYRKVAVSAWPIRAYLERSNLRLAENLLQNRLHLASRIENLASRSEALLILLQAARPFASALWEPILWAIVDAAEPALSWRQGRNLRIAIELVMTDHPDLVQAVYERLPNDKALSSLKRHPEKRRPSEPRPFFWIR